MLPNPKSITQPPLSKQNPDLKQHKTELPLIFSEVFLTAVFSAPSTVAIALDEWLLQELWEAAEEVALAQWKPVVGDPNTDSEGIREDF